MLTLIKIFYLRYKCILFITELRMVKALGISECCKVTICILYVDPHQRPFFFRYKSILFITALRMVKALGISACCKVNKSIFYTDPHQNPLDISECSQVYAFCLLMSDEQIVFRFIHPLLYTLLSIDD